MTDDFGIYKKPERILNKSSEFYGLIKLNIGYSTGYLTAEQATRLAADLINATMRKLDK